MADKGHTSKKGFFNRIRHTAVSFAEVDPFTESASLAFTTIFAVPGVMIIALAVASTFYDGNAVRDALYGQAAGFIGPETSATLREAVEKAAGSKSGLLAKIIGVVALVLSATAAFASLQSSLNKIWRVKPQPGRAVVRYLLARAISLGLIAALGFLLLVSMVLDAVLAMLLERTDGQAQTWLAALGGTALSFGMVSLVFALVFKFLPDVRIQWRSVWVGAVFTGGLFTLGKFLIGLYITKTGAGDAYGAGGAIVILLLWIYYSSILLLFGAQYTRTTAQARGLPIWPAPHARKEKP